MAVPARRFFLALALVVPAVGGAPPTPWVRMVTAEGRPSAARLTLSPLWTLRGGASGDGGPDDFDVEDEEEEEEDEDKEEDAAGGGPFDRANAEVMAAIWADAGCLLSQQGQPAAAVRALSLSLSLAPPGWNFRPRLLSFLGMTLKEAGPESLPDAIAVLQAAAASLPDDANVWWNLGTCLYQARRAGEAAEAYMRACNVADEDWEGIPPILNNLATVLLDQLHAVEDPALRDQYLEVAIRTLRESVRREPAAACTLANLANALWAASVRHGAGSGSGSGTPSGTSGALPAPPFMDVGPGPVLPCSTDEQLRRLEEVVGVLERALEVVPPNWPHTDQLFIKLGLALFAKGEFDRATHTLLAALRYASQDPASSSYPPEWWCAVVHYLSVALQRAKASEGTVQQALRVVCDACPRLPECQAEIGRSMLRLGLFDEALGHLKEALALAKSLRGPNWPSRAAVLHSLGHAHALNGDLDGAIAAFREALDKEPLAASTRFLLSRALAENGEEDAALAQLETAAQQGLWVSDRLLQGSAFEEIRSHPRFRLIRERMRQNAVSGHQRHPGSPESPS